MSYILVVADPDWGSSTSIGGETREQALAEAIEWLGGTIRWLEESDE